MHPKFLTVVLYVPTAGTNRGSPSRVGPVHRHAYYPHTDGGV